MRRYFLRSRRLGLSTWSPDDIRLARELWGDARVTRLFGGPFSDAAVEARLTAEIEMQAQHGCQYWPIFLLQDDSHAGCSGLRPLPSRHGVLELGIHLRPEFWGRGLATEAARVVITYAFGTLGATALFAGHHPANQDSRRVVQRLGFRYVGDELYEPTGLEHPSYLLTVDDWTCP